MHFAPPTRRAAAVLAASTIGLSTAFLGVSGVASAITPDLYPFTFSTDPLAYPDQPITDGGTLSVPAGYCSIDWVVTGAAGGSDTNSTASPTDGTEVHATTAISGAQTYTFHTGAMGGDGSTAGGTGGTGGDGANGTAGVDDGTGNFGGGGGGATTVDQGGSVFLEAPGGAGVGASSGNGAGGGTVVTPAGATSTSNATSASYGKGVVSGTANACPGAPTVNWVSGGVHSLSFQLDKGYLPDGVSITGTQYSLDGGTWTTVATDVAGGYQYSGTITGLTTGQQYSVQFRFTTTGDDGNPSDATTAAPVLPAPANVGATVAANSIKISWQPPAEQTGLVGYQAWVIPGADPQSNNGEVDCPDMAATARSCTVTVKPGTVYTVEVAALGASDRGMEGSVVSDVVPEPTAPATVPTGSGKMSTPSGAVAATLTTGQQVTLTGSGYAPNSTIELFIYSTPQKIGTALTDASGSFTATVTVPASLAPGDHHLVAAGLDPSGSMRYLRTDVSVATPANQLAWTGFETLPYVVAGLAALVIGGGLVLVGRRRRTA